ncbi:MAG: prephenate dehydratase, partial [Gammaproteobacteria bacterium]
YVFYIDVDGHSDDPAVTAALADLEQEAFAVRVLGSYPKSVI